jgi:hypothetical protein
MTTYTDPRPECVCDSECYVNYWSIGFQATDGRRRVFELFDGNPLDRQGIATIFRNWRVYTFNGQKYDIPMIMLAMSGASNAELKQFSDDLIQSGVPHWTLMQRKGLTVPDYIDHVDLMNVSPGAPTMPSLKIYAGRLHSRKMQELPIEIDERIGEAERQIIRDYHGNDLEVRWADGASVHHGEGHHLQRWCSLHRPSPIRAGVQHQRHPQRCSVRDLRGRYAVLQVLAATRPQK